MVDEAFVCALDAAQVRDRAGGGQGLGARRRRRPPPPLTAPPLPTSADFLQEYFELRPELEAALRAGHLNLSRTRYAGGGDRLSPASAPAAARALVRLAPAGGGEWELRAAQAGADDAAEPAAGGFGGGGAPDVISQLAAEYGCAEQVDAARGGGGGGGRAAAAEPLRWFGGALPPVPLREAQRDFCAALELAVRLANAQRRAAAAAENYRESITAGVGRR
jgi:hypothetical protein